MKNTINNPLILSDTQYGYKVNKPLDQSGKYVDYDIAAELLEALKQIASIKLLSNTTINAPLQHAIETANNAIKKATT